MTTLGAIRWDGFYDMTVNSPGRYTAGSLGPERWQSRAPLHGKLGRNTVTWEHTQATMDAEIAAAATCVDYWAFLKYPAGGLSTGFNLYQTSANKADINWCWITQTSRLGSTGNYATEVAELVTHMQQSNYQKVLTNRPLLYLYYTDSEIATYWGGSDANLKACLDALRSDVQSAGLGNPYIVLMRYSIASTAVLRVTLGCDAITSYSPIAPESLNRSYATWMGQVEDYWDSLVSASSGSKIVPIGSYGWNPQPRIEIVNPYGTYNPYIGINIHCVALPTNSQITGHTEQAFLWVAANPSACEADTILMYAWNEFDEGGWIAPTHGDPTGLRCAAVAAGRS